MLERDFFLKETEDLAQALVGKILVRETPKGTIRGRIVETEAYLGVEDPACHAYQGRHTKRNHPLYMKAGTLYVHQIYGIHRLLNIINKEEGTPEGVLIRAVEIMEGLDLASKSRFSKPFEALSPYQRKNISNGPGKLTQALLIDKSFNEKNIFSEDLHLEDDGYKPLLEKDKRIGIDYAGEAALRPLRFFEKDNPRVSKKKSA